MNGQSCDLKTPLRFIFPLLAVMMLAACGNRVVPYSGTCAQQTRQFVDYIHSLVIDELNPLIEDGFQSASSADITKRIETLDERVSEINTPKCNAAKTEAVKDALRQYMLETKNYFSTVAGRAVYGEGQVQAHLSKVNEAGLAFEVALDEVRR
jgi:hypothetical protein